MTQIPAPQMITVLVTVTHADRAKYGEDAWLINSVRVGQFIDDIGPWWTIETPIFNGPGSGNIRSLAAQLHLARTQRDHRVSRISRVSQQEDAEIQAELDDYSARSYRAELRLIAKG
jgi:hypothetical protein